MSTDYYRRQIQSAQSEIARLQRDKGNEARKIAGLSSRISSASQAANRSTSVSSVQSKLRDIERYERDKASVEKRIADLESRIANAHTKLHDAQSNLVREEEREARKRQQDAEQAARRHSEQMRAVSGSLARHDAIHRHTLEAIKKLTQLPERIVVLFLAANPLDQEQLRLDEEVRAITEMIRKAKHRDAVELRSCWAVRPMDVLQAINEYKPTVVHFSGHGSDQDEIVFQDDAGNAKLVSKDAVVQLMKASSGDIRLVFFNTCYSHNQAQAVTEHVEAAIGMKTSIGDAAARVFASQFYSAIGFGLSVQKAFEQARALVMMEGIPESDTPELFLRTGLTADTTVLVRPPSESQAGTHEGLTG
jgi:hypothetical protein